MLQQVQTKDSYEYYKEKNKSKILYSVYKDIIDVLNFKVTSEIIKGEKFVMPYRLGQIYAVRADRAFKLNKIGKPKMLIDFGSTNKLKKEGKLVKDKFVYYTSPEYCFIKWSLAGARVSGIFAYVFKPSKTNGVESKVGFMNRFYTFVNSNELNSLIYPKEKKKIK
jgi:hypothetical protein